MPIYPEEGGSFSETLVNISNTARYQNPENHSLNLRRGNLISYESKPCMKLLHLHLESRLRICGAIPPIPNTTSWRGAQLKKKAQ
jgi:hypothetical protein